MPTTPIGTRTWRICSPLASVEPRTTSPTGSGSAATSRTAWATAATRCGSRASRSSRPCGIPPVLPRSRSSSFAATIRSVASTRPSASACSAASLSARDSSASRREAVRAARAAVTTCSTAAGSISAMGQGYAACAASTPLFETPHFRRLPLFDPVCTRMRVRSPCRPDPLAGGIIGGDRMNARRIGATLASGACSP